MTHYRNYLAIAYTDRPAKAAVLRTVLDTSILTIEQVRTARGDIAYKMYARQDKRVGKEMLKLIRDLIDGELARQ